jgi:putative tricarboxylic transport membrane protein
VNGRTPRQIRAAPTGEALKGRRRDLTIAGACGAVALAYLLADLQYPITRNGEVGPGLFPLMVGSLLLVSTIGFAIERRGHVSFDEASDVAKPRTGGGHWRALFILAAAATYIVVLPIFGDLLSTLITSLVVLRARGMSRWLPSLGLAIGLSVLIHVCFVVLLGVPLPEGRIFG